MFIIVYLSRTDNLTPASENENDERIKEIVDRGVMEELAELVLKGDGDLLLRQRSDNPEIQLFLNNVPNYMVSPIYVFRH